jgi:hypothetical protein
MGISLSLVGVLLLVGQSLGRTPLVDSLAATSAVVPAVTDVYNISTNLLKEMAISFFITGLLVVFASVLAGPAKFAVAFRREVAPFLRDYLPASTVAVVFLFLLLIWWAPTHGFRTTGGLIVNSLLAISGFIALVLMTRREFPDAVAPDFSHIDDWFRGHWDNAKGYVEDRTKREPKTEVISTTEVPAVKGEEKDLKLAQLKSLHEAGALNDAEFDAAVKRLSE